MNTRLFSSLAIATAALMSATAANAAITLYSVNPATDPYSGPTPTYTFDLGSRPTITGGSIENSSSTNNFLRPTGSTGDYYAVGPTPGTPGTLSNLAVGPINSISFLWGSVDSYNTLDFMGSGTVPLAHFTGTDILPGADGTQSEVVTFLLTGTDATNFQALRLSSSVNAFEIDNLAINPVPEPATWGMMLLGFGAIGFAMRRRRSPVLAQVA